MDERRIPLQNDKPKYKKKSDSRGLPRSKHKHEYEPVLLHMSCEFHHQKLDDIISVHEVCQICGRVGKSLHGEEWYDTKQELFRGYLIGRSILNKKALALPKWYTHDYFDKFAYKNEKGE